MKWNFIKAPKVGDSHWCESEGCTSYLREILSLSVAPLTELQSKMITLVDTGAYNRVIETRKIQQCWKHTYTYQKWNFFIGENKFDLWRSMEQNISEDNSILSKLPTTNLRQVVQKNTIWSINLWPIYRQRKTLNWILLQFHFNKIESEI